jgi:hypothetical protein
MISLLILVGLVLFVAVIVAVVVTSNKKNKE